MSLSELDDLSEPSVCCVDQMFVEVSGTYSYCTFYAPFEVLIGLSHLSFASRTLMGKEIEEPHVLQSFKSGSFSGDF